MSCGPETVTLPLNAFSMVIAVLIMGALTEIGFSVWETWFKKKA